MSGDVVRTRNLVSPSADVACTTVANIFIVRAMRTVNVQYNYAVLHTFM
jgi:hypothetical protein